MINPVSSIPLLTPSAPTTPASRTTDAGAFRNLLEESIRQVDGAQKSANVAIDRFVSGEQEDPHTVALAVQRAELSLDLFLQVRNKVSQAYQEIMRMQV
jgi:flagellar hook-basal body complex protein FliE